MFIEMYAGHPSPGQGITVEELTKELGHVTQLVGLQSMHCRILKLKVFDTRMCLTERS